MFGDIAVSRGRTINSVCMFVILLMNQEEGVEGEE